MVDANYAIDIVKQTALSSKNQHISSKIGTYCYIVDIFADIAILDAE